MLKLGSSVPWPDAMEKITGQRQMSAVPLVKYFQPLLDYLEQENAKNNETIEWPDTEWLPNGKSYYKTFALVFGRILARKKSILLYK